MSTSFDDFMRDMEAEAYQTGPESEAAFVESQQRHWIGRRLSERRRELGYTQAKLSALSGINQSVFFQAEDGIRDDLVTGVQTCALPIWSCFTPKEPSPRETAPP